MSTPQHKFLVAPLPQSRGEGAIAPPPRGSAAGSETQQQHLGSVFSGHILCFILRCAPSCTVIICSSFMCNK